MLTIRCIKGKEISDTQRIAPIECDANASTKSQIFTEVSRLYGPLSLYLPVSLRGRILLSELWEKGLGWNEQVPREFLSRGRAFHLTSLDWRPFSPLEGTSVKIRLATFICFVMHRQKYIGSLPTWYRATNFTWFLSRLRWHA